MIFFPLNEAAPSRIEATEVFAHIQTRREAFPNARFAIMNEYTYDSVKWEIAFRIRDLKDAGVAVSAEPEIDGLKVMVDSSLMAGVIVLR